MQPEEKQKHDLIYKAISIVIQRRLDELKKSQRSVAHEYGVETSYVSRMKNKKNEPLLFHFWKMINALGMKPSEFFVLLEKELPEDFILYDL